MRANGFDGKDLDTIVDTHVYHVYAIDRDGGETVSILRTQLPVEYGLVDAAALAMERWKAEAREDERIVVVEQELVDGLAPGQVTAVRAYRLKVDFTLTD